MDNYSMQMETSHTKVSGKTINSVDKVKFTTIFPTLQSKK